MKIDAFGIFKRLLISATENISQSFYDEFVETNAKIKSKAGVKVIITRRQLGKCCNWCAKLTGSYDINEAPDGIYQRHLNCKCMVTVKNEKGFTDVWSKKEFATQKEARKEREKELLKEKAVQNKYLKERARAKSNGSSFYDATREWFERADKANSSVTRGTYFKVENKKYKLGEKGVVWDHSKKEIEIAELISKELGGNIILLPRVIEPEKIQSADYLYNAEYWDLKEIEGTSQKVLYNAAHKKKKQSNNFIYEISKTPISEEEINRQAKELFSLAHTDFVNKVIIIKNNKILKILERI